MAKFSKEELEYKDFMGEHRKHFIDKRQFDLERHMNERARETYIETPTENALEDFLYGRTDKLPALVDPNPDFKFPVPLPDILDGMDPREYALQLKDPKRYAKEVYGDE